MIYSYILGFIGFVCYIGYYFFKDRITEKQKFAILELSILLLLIPFIAQVYPIIKKLF